MVERILEKIKEMGLSCSAVEKTLGFGNGAIRRFETSSPSIEKIEKLSNFLNVSIDWLVKGDNNFSNLTQNEEKVLMILNSLETETEQLSLISYIEGYVDRLLCEKRSNEGADAQQRTGKVG